VARTTGAAEGFRIGACATEAVSGSWSYLGGAFRSAQQLQQTGVPPSIMQQVQPAFIMAAMHSQHAWIMAQQSLSPLVQVIVQPFSVISHLHIPIIRLQAQTTIPFIIMQQLHMPPAIIMQRFCIMPADIASSQVQVIFMPPVHFSIAIVQRGTIIMFMPAGAVAAAPIIPVPMPMAGAPIPVMLIPARSISFVVIGLAPGSQVKSRAGSNNGTLRRVRAQTKQMDAPVQDGNSEKY
jgi:hypothetical protein